MNQRLRHPLRDRTHGRRSRRARAAAQQPLAVPTAQQPTAPAAPVRDRAIERAQEAGGPLDTACYSCGCGLLFDAPVSTTVTCPHCGAGQAW